MDRKLVEVGIRPATPGDAVLLAELGATTFFDTYASDLDHTELKRHIAEIFGPEKQQVELANSNWHFQLVEANGVAAGYMGLYEGDTPPEVSGVNAICLARIYILQDHIGLGIGAKLMQACLNLAGALGYEALWLTVWERNLRAIDFYTRWGFAQAGTTSYQFGDEIQTDLLLWRMIEP